MVTWHDGPVTNTDRMRRLFRALQKAKPAEHDVRIMTEVLRRVSIALPSPADLDRTRGAVAALRSSGRDDEARSLEAVVRFADAVMAERRRRSAGEFLTVAGAARALGAPARTVERWLTDGLLSATTIDGAPRVSRAELSRFRNEARARFGASPPGTSPPEPAAAPRPAGRVLAEKRHRAHALVRRRDDGEALTSAEETELRALVAELDDLVVAALRQPARARRRA